MADSKKDTNIAATEDDALAAPVTLPEDTGEGGKLKMLMQLVKKCMGVKDIASMRLSLPASLLEPVPNLEYWHYLDRPDLFAAINDSEDPFERMLAVLRFTFSKDLRHIRGKVCKPYNSVLGEHFRSHWDVIPVSYPADPSQPPIQHHALTDSAPKLPHPHRAESLSGAGYSSPAVDTSSSNSGGTGSTVESNVDAQMSNLSLVGTDGAVSTSTSVDPSRGEGAAVVVEAEAGREAESGVLDDGKIRIVYLTEQVSHHPPISSFYVTCPAKKMAMAGVDQISAKVTSTAAVRIGPGSQNKGLFVQIEGGPGEGEKYQVTHPSAVVNGLLRGSLYVTVSESTIITCTGGKGVGDGEQLRAIIEYKEESWLGKSQYLIEGCIHTYNPSSSDHVEWTRVKHVPKALILANLEGSWRGTVRWRSSPDDSKDWNVLLDLNHLNVVPKTVRPLERQLPDESRKLWEKVTNKLVGKEFGEANKYKQAIEQRQREEAAERKKKGVEFVPKYFEKDIESGMPMLTEEGRRAIEEELREGLPAPAPAVSTSTSPKPPLSAASTETAVPSAATAAA
ncbi:uncharacterized protein STEHIDRAFT_65725 [Stereum hirsutum FP-91666 SS1]|uniref:uncharacterized protein n=1 Tax=Stereum hirsutum (strain FP-91666) TaxID=721885 RepID=UPI000444A019|nr:uncharacterized protein STEHIDRAFT_65725 [Stereum hirsutum FP-91666 SS1]EIM81944.1 hypothetical protein STEHIDRAFT_65725 [Stereum hirsutum FP-91666 SS1]